MSDEVIKKLNELEAAIDKLTPEELSTIIKESVKRNSHTKNCWSIMVGGIRRCCDLPSPPRKSWICTGDCPINNRNKK